jgi:hypothetical protein
MVTPSTQDCCHVALELSRAKWLVGALLDVLGRFATRASREAGPRSDGLGRAP